MVPDPLVELLQQAREQRRPVLQLTPRRLAEVLGAPPPAGWLESQAATWRAAGFALTVDPDRGWVVFTPVDDDAGPAPVDVRVQVAWQRPAIGLTGPGLVRSADAVAEAADVATAPDGAAVATTVTVTTAEGVRELGLDDPAVRQLSLLAARLAGTAEKTAGPVGGGSGI